MQTSNAVLFVAMTVSPWMAGCHGTVNDQTPGDFPVDFVAVFEPNKTSIGGKSLLRLEVSTASYVGGGMPFRVEIKNSSGFEFAENSWSGYLDPGRNASHRIDGTAIQRGRWSIETAAYFENGSMSVEARPTIEVT